MNINPFFNVFLVIFLFVWTCNNVFSPGIGTAKLNTTSSSQNTTIISDQAAADGLDLQLLPGLLKTSKTAEEFEKSLNKPNGINNLDLNNDGIVDYLKVDEFGDKKTENYGFSITTEVAEGEIQEIATIEIKQEGDQIKVNTAGNEQVYGRSYGYNASYGIGTFLMWSYLLSPRTFYRSPYYYQNYPRNYQPQRTASRTDYANRASRFEKSTTQYKGGASQKSPNYNKTANSGIKRSLRQPTASQKSFQSRLKSRPSTGRKSGFFGRSSSRSSTGFFGRNRSVRGFSGLSRGFGGFGK